jgi:hypothetical protein
MTTATKGMIVLLLFYFLMTIDGKAFRVVRVIGSGYRGTEAKKVRSADLRLEQACGLL